MLWSGLDQWNVDRSVRASRARDLAGALGDWLVREDESREFWESRDSVAGGQLPGTARMHVSGSTDWGFAPGEAVVLNAGVRCATSS